MLLTDELRRQQAMLFPASVQLLSVERLQDGQLSGSYDGAPMVVDLLHFAPWESWRTGVSQWQRTSSDVLGHFKLEGERRVVLPHFEWRDPKMPTLQILDSLASAKWQRGQPPKAHALDSPKRFNVSDPVQQRD